MVLIITIILILEECITIQTFILVSLHPDKALSAVSLFVKRKCPSVSSAHLRISSSVEQRNQSIRITIFRNGNNYILLNIALIIPSYLDMTF